MIICLDGLGTSEFEFFSIISKLRRDLKVYVYSAAHSESRTAKAVELGATGPVTREILAELAGSPPVPMTVETPARTSERMTDKPVSPPNAQHGHASVAHAIPTPEQPRIDDEDAPKHARVPWLRYSDRPARVAPSRREPPPQPPDPQLQAPTPSRSCEPLLTEEELRALMSDDIAAIVADQPQPRWPDDDTLARGIP